jgi:SRSO17 transposase
MALPVGFNLWAVDRLREDPRGMADRRMARGHEHPSDYWISNLPADTEPEQFARLARLRWMIELDHKQLKGELGLDH